MLKVKLYLYIELVKFLIYDVLGKMHEVKDATGKDVHCDTPWHHTIMYNKNI